ncbi:MAG: hypothetical protein HYU69_06560 [Bacteroidetes bacterium]|nr:hypothetical protein [Bacteroidota bacterium]
MIELKIYSKKVWVFLLLLFVSFAVGAMQHIKVTPKNPVPIDFKITILITDTTQVSGIEVSLGTTNSSPNDILHYTFVFDVALGLPAGLSYSRSEQTVELTLGSFTENAELYGQYIIVHTDGTRSEPEQFSHR